MYPLGCTTLTRKELKKLFRPVLDTILHSLGLNKHFPLSLTHAGPTWLGLGIDEFSSVHGVAQLQLLLGHLNIQDRTGTLIEIERDYLELLAGLGKCPLAHPIITQYEYLPNTWITSICSFLHHTNSQVIVRSQRIITIQRENDQFLMELAIQGGYKLELVQQCRLWLQVATLADICNA